MYKLVTDFEICGFHRNKKKKKSLERSINFSSNKNVIHYIFTLLNGLVPTS